MRISSWVVLLVLVFVSCVPVQVGQGGLRIYDFKFESDYRDQNNRSYICNNKRTTLSFSFGYNDFAKIAGWEAQLIGVRTGATLPRLSQTRNGGGFQVVGNRIVVSWVLDVGVAPQSIVVNPVPQPNVVGATSLELLVRATDGGTVMLRLTDLPVVDNCS